RDEKPARPELRVVVTERHDSPVRASVDEDREVPNADTGRSVVERQLDVVAAYEAELYLRHVACDEASIGGDGADVGIHAVAEPGHRELSVRARLRRVKAERDST